MCALQALAVALMIAGAAGMVTSLTMLARNQWVYRVRLEMLFGDFDRYQRLASYSEMMRRFWVWDVAAFDRGNA